MRQRGMEKSELIHIGRSQYPSAESETSRHDNLIKNVLYNHRHFRNHMSLRRVN